MPTDATPAFRKIPEAESIARWGRLFSDSPAPLIREQARGRLEKLKPLIAAHFFEAGCLLGPGSFQKAAKALFLKEELSALAQEPDSSGKCPFMRSFSEAPQDFQAELADALVSFGADLSRQAGPNGAWRFPWVLPQELKDGAPAILTLLCARESFAPFVSYMKNRPALFGPLLRERIFCRDASLLASRFLLDCALHSDANYFIQDEQSALSRAFSGGFADPMSLAELTPLAFPKIRWLLSACAEHPEIDVYSPFGVMYPSLRVRFEAQANAQDRSMSLGFSATDFHQLLHSIFSSAALAASYFIEQDEIKSLSKKAPKDVFLRNDFTNPVLLICSNLFDWRLKLPNMNPFTGGAPGQDHSQLSPLRDLFPEILTPDERARVCALALLPALRSGIASSMSDKPLARAAVSSALETLCSLTGPLIQPASMETRRELFKPCAQDLIQRLSTADGFAAALEVERHWKLISGAFALGESELAALHPLGTRFASMARELTRHSAKNAFQAAREELFMRLDIERALGEEAFLKTGPKLRV